MKGQPVSSPAGGIFTGGTMNEATQKKIGTILKGSEERDAIHVAVASVVADAVLKPGQHIGVVNGHATRHGTMVGIVDPYLQRTVMPGQRFWCFLYPMTVTSLRHEWTHPAFDQRTGPQDTDKAMAEEWLRNFAEGWRFDYDEMIQGAYDGSFVTADGIDIHSAAELADGDEDKFWACIETLSGRRFDHAHRRNFTWSCSC